MDMLISCPNCRRRQYAPLAVAEGTDPWPCEECGQMIYLPRRDIAVRKEKKDGKNRRDPRP
jgi:hypothetical protein